MTNPYYTPSGSPATGSAGSSAVMRSELSLIQAAFDKMPVLSGNALRPVFVNTGATAIEAVSAATALTRLGLGSGDSVAFTNLDLTGTLKIKNSTGTDWGAFSHDGTDFNTVFVNTTDWNITLEGRMLIGATTATWTGVAIDNTSVNAVSVLDINHTGEGLWIEAACPGSGYSWPGFAGTHFFGFNDVQAPLYIAGAGQAYAKLARNGAVYTFDIITGVKFRIYDATNVDHVDFAHDGTNLSLTGTTTSNMDLYAMNLRLRGGVALTIFDSGNTDSVTQSHDGTNYNIAAQNTTNINITGITNIVLGGANVLYSGSPLGTPSSGVATNLTGTASGLTSGDSTKWNGANKTVSTSAPSGGANGDMWFEREA